MNYQVKSHDLWTEYNSEQHPLLPLLKKLVGRMEPLTIAAAGAGGKTTLLLHLAEECAKQNTSVLVTTTTHMLLPEDQLGIPAAAGKITWLGTPAAPVFRKNGWIKCQAPAPKALELYRRNHALTLIEADGSRMLPLKIPDCREPVIADRTDLLLVVYGLSALGQPLSRICHRPELLPASCRGADCVTPDLMGTLMKEYYLDPMAEKYPGMRLIPVWNQADTPERICAAKTAARCCGRDFQLITSFYLEH